jgi:hypothetical protein
LQIEQHGAGGRRHDDPCCRRGESCDGSRVEVIGVDVCDDDERWRFQPLESRHLLWADRHRRHQQFREGLATRRRWRRRPSESSQIRPRQFLKVCARHFRLRRDESRWIDQDDVLTVDDA